MATRRVIKSALANFLSSYTSRYSDYDGYWLFGFLVGELVEIRIDLLDSAVNSSNSPREAARRIATAKFSDQCRKANAAASYISRAWLTITKLPGSVKGPVNGHTTNGFNVKFAAEVVDDLTRHYVRERNVFVAQHNPAIEMRSSRSDS